MQGNREIWRSIDGYDNYEVSTHGRVRNATTARILKPCILPLGYQQVGLCKNGKSKRFFIHRLVAQEFIDNPDEKDLVDHINHDVSDNCVSNLRWVSAKENQGNRNKMQNASSKYKGVFFNRRNRKWLAQIRIDGCSKYLGYFNVEKEAAKAYNVAAAHNFGEYALLNEISDEDEDNNEDVEEDEEED